MMNTTELRNYAYISSDYSSKPIKAICLTFPGLNSTQMRTTLDYNDIILANHGILFVYPFVNPWNWMNDQTVKFTDEILRLTNKEFNLSQNSPLIFRGGSMGGYSALTYGMFSIFRPEGILANCPVTDLYYHHTERPDLPRTINDAMGSYEDISEILKNRSPIYHPEKLPDCRYLIIHGFEDKSVNKAIHSDQLVMQMRKREMNVTYIEDKKMAHCSPISHETIAEIDKFFNNWL